jgi:glutaredoxin
MPGKKIKITLYHAKWCGHCVTFFPIWKKMAENEVARKNIDFEEHEQQTFGSLSADEMKINDEPIDSFPTIRININNTDYNYTGGREPDDIYQFIIDRLKGVSMDTNPDIHEISSDDNRQDMNRDDLDSNSMNIGRENLPQNGGKRTLIPLARRIKKHELAISNIMKKI